MAMEPLLNALKAAADPTRLRILALCSEGELTVSELTDILGQSQPRVSRHLRLLAEAGLLDRFREGSWVFHRLSTNGLGRRIAEAVTPLIPESGDPGRDKVRLAEVKVARARAAADYFRRNAARWNSLRSLHVSEADVERALLRLVPQAEMQDLLDIGTGTGRILELLGPRVGHAVGIDLSHDMLSIARASLARQSLRNCAVRQADMMALPFEDRSFDLVTVHQVLHFADQPAGAIAEAARVLRPGGRMIVVDFLPHDLETLRAEHEHRRLGFSDAEVASWLARARLEPGETVHLAGDPLTVALWSAARPDERERKAR